VKCFVDESLSTPKTSDTTRSSSKVKHFYANTIPVGFPSAYSVFKISRTILVGKAATVQAQIEFGKRRLDVRAHLTRQPILHDHLLRAEDVYIVAAALGFTAYVPVVDKIVEPRDPVGTRWRSTLRNASGSSLLFRL
jgi:hypothetical protein